MRMLVPLLLLCGTALAAGDDDAWWQDQPQERALTVNEGELVFLRQPPAKAVHHHANRVMITRATLQNGWAHLEQCHENLDPVGELQIVFNPDRVRKLVIRKTRNVGRAFVEGATIQLRDIRHHALICLSAETHSLEPLGAGLYELRSGPFMRRFLDGYYPMHLTFEVDYPDDVALVESTPNDQPGLEVLREPQRILLDAWF
jgi:hypothetical protein